MFPEKVEPSTTGPIKVADGHETPVIGQGTVPCEAEDWKVALQNVLLVPEMEMNLLSVGQVARQGYQIVFGDSVETSYVAEKGKLDTPLCHFNLQKTQNDGVLYLLRDETPVERKISLAETVPQVMGWAGGAWGSSPYDNSGTWETWHARLGHKSGPYLKKLVDGAARDVKVKGKRCDLVGCTTCAMGKLSRSSFQRKLNGGKPLEALNLIHMDLMGPMDVLGRHKSKYLLTLTDDATNFIWTFELKKKKHAEVKIREWFALAERQFPQFTIKGFRSDRGGEFMSNSFRAWLTEKGVFHDLACQYSPQQNEKAERMNRTLAEMARCMLIGSGLPKSYWEYALRYATWIQNRNVNTKQKTVTAYELLYGEKPSLAMAKVFGSMAQVHIPEERRKRKAGNKLDPRARWGICLGPAPNAKAWVFHYMDNQKIGHSRDAYFHEQLTYQKWRVMETKLVNDMNPRVGEKAEFGDPFTRVYRLPKDFPQSWPLSTIGERREVTSWEEECYPVALPHDTEDDAADKAAADDDDPEEEDEEDEADVRDSNDEIYIGPPEGMVQKEDGKNTAKFGQGRYPLRSRTTVKPFSPSTSVVIPISHVADTWDIPPSYLPSEKEVLSRLPDDEEEWETAFSATQAGLTSLEKWRQRYPFLPSADTLPKPPETHPPDYVEPNSFRDALKDIYAADWVVAAAKEYGQIEDKEVWEWAHPPPGTPIMGTKWVFVRKTLVDGSLDKFKGRICVQGYMSILGIHHNNTFAPTASAPAARILFALGCAEDWDIHQMDVSGAFLYADLQEEIFCRPPEGFKDPEKRVWRLKKSLYGLKQAPREWIAHLGRVLKKAGFVQCPNEPSLWKLVDEETGDKLFLLDFVDDFLLGTKSQKLMKYTKEVLMANFAMTDLGPAEKYLGWHITRDREQGKLWLSLEPRIQRAVVEFGLADAKPTGTPLPAGFQVWLPHEMDKDNPQRRPPLDSKDKYSELLSPEQHSHYRSGVGFINYVACALRPDVAYAAGQLSQVLHIPRERHYQAMFHCLRYLKGTADLALCYDRKSVHQLLAYTDSDYAGCSGTRRSVSGGIFTFAGGPVHWFSRKQDNITLSATEAEFGAMSEGTREIRWLRLLLEDFGHPQSGPTPLYVDNLGAVLQSKDPLLTRHSRHVGVNMGHVREQQLEFKTIFVIHKKAEGQMADYLTKAVEKVKLDANIAMAGQEERPLDKGKEEC